MAEAVERSRDTTFFPAWSGPGVGLLIKGSGCTGGGPAVVSQCVDISSAGTYVFGIDILDSRGAAPDPTRTCTVSIDEHSDNTCSTLVTPGIGSTTIDFPTLDEHYEARSSGPVAGTGSLELRVSCTCTGPGTGGFQYYLDDAFLGLD